MDIATTRPKRPKGRFCERKKKLHSEAHTQKVKATYLKF